MEMMDVPDPVISGDGDVLVRMARMGVCGSDVHYYVDGKIGSQVVEFPWTVGHEGSGVVEAVGASVSRVRPGDRIALDPAMPCFSCDQCLAGRPHTCRVLRFLGCPGQVEGCLAEAVVMPETSCLPIPDTMTFDEAALVEPLSIAVYGGRLAPPFAGASVGILGAGPIGLCMTMVARAAGARRVVVTDVIEARADFARGIGADWAGHPADPAISTAAGDGLDIAIECCGRQEALDQAIELLRPGGELLVIGIPEPDRVSFDISLLRRKEIGIRNVRRQNDCMHTALNLIGTRQVDAKALITHRFAFSESDKAFDLVSNYRDGVVKATIEW